MGYQVVGVFCVEGNPTQAWNGTEGEDDEVHVPNDVWQEQTHEFDDIDEAKDFIRGLEPQMTTHVALESDGEVLCYMDSDADHLDDAAPGVLPPSQAPAQPLPGENLVDESLTPYESQEV
jgi:hypothetical protein